MNLSTGVPGLKPYYKHELFILFNLDCLKLLKSLPDNSIDSCVTDPPYGWSFMGKKWDYDVPPVEVWKELLRVLKPGAHILVACGTRTQHRMTINIEDAGFEIRDIITWLYSSGFPKSHNISKAIDKRFGSDGVVVETVPQTGAKFKLHQELIDNGGFNDPDRTTFEITEPETDETKEWDGWSTALKPSVEMFTLARKPLSEKTIADNVLKWGTGALNIDGCRVGTSIRHNPSSKNNNDNNVRLIGKESETQGRWTQGRWPANLIHDGSEEVTDGFPDNVSGVVDSTQKAGYNKIYGQFDGSYEKTNDNISDSGSAARYFYIAKANTEERNVGLDDIESKHKEGANFRPNHMEKALDGDSENPFGRWNKIKNNHPTVKPVSLMRYLIRLITPPNGIVIDPYTGSGSTGMGAMVENVKFIGTDLEKEYCEMAKRRILFTIDNPDFFTDKKAYKKRKKTKKLKSNKLF